MHREQDCIFCQIVRGDAPSFRLYEDELTYAFLDIFPVGRGHSLVIPKLHGDDIFECDADVLAAIARTTKRIAHALRDELNPDGVGVYQLNGAAAGQVVFHYHVHLIPRMAGSTLSLHGRVRADDEELRALAETLSATVARSSDPAQQASEQEPGEDKKEGAARP